MQILTENIPKIPLEPFFNYFWYNEKKLNNEVDFMFNKLSSRIAEYLYAHNCFEKEIKEVYVYGIEVFLSAISGIALLLLTSIITGYFLEGVIFLIAFISLRHYTGGYHCMTYLRCNVMFILSFLTCISLYYLTFYIDFIIIIPIIVICGIIFALLSPIENKNKPLTQNEKKKFKILAVAVYALQIAVFIPLYLSGVKEVLIALPTYLIIAFAMFAAMAENKRSKSCEQD